MSGVARLIDAKNYRAARWCESYGVLDDAPLMLVLLLATSANAIGRRI